MIGNLSIWELMVILVLVVVIFGGRKLPELGRGLGQGLANFRRAVREPDSAAKPPDPASPADPASAASSPDQASPAETPAKPPAGQAGSASLPDGN